MKSEYLIEKQQSFVKSFDQERLNRIEVLLKEFYSQFPIKNLDKVTIDEYVYGRFNTDHIETFSYWMEKKLSSFGRISGSPAFQYGIWYGTHGKDKVVKYRHTERYGSTVELSFRKIIEEIKKLLIYGRNHDHAAIEKSMLGEKLKGKILATYFPNDYLSIYASVYLDDILRYFNLDTADSYYKKAIYKQQILIAFKNADPEMKGWSLMKFAMFINDELYTNYYKETASKNDDNRVPEFPDLALINPEYIENEIDPRSRDASPASSKSFEGLKKDYVKATIRNKAIGDRGEQIVVMMERKQLEAAGRPDLAKKVKWVAEKTDGLGYDILSKELTGDDKHIEVKSTVRAAGHAQFYLSAPEFLKAGKLDNFYIYYVYDVQSKEPKIWKIPNPFYPAQEGVFLKTAVYNVTIYKK